MPSIWADACETVVEKPLQALLDSAYSSCGATVKCAATSAELQPFYCTLQLLMSSCSDKFAYADCCVLLDCSLQQRHGLPVVSAWHGGAAAHVAFVRMVQRADDVRQLRRSCDLDGVDAGYKQRIQSQKRWRHFTI